jgi:hypothetical protein
VELKKNTTLPKRRRLKIPFLARIYFGKPEDKTMENWRREARRQSSRCRLKIPYQSYMSPGVPQQTSMVNRHRASWRQHRIPHWAKRKFGTICETMLAKRRQASRGLSSRRRQNIPPKLQDKPHDVIPHSLKPTPSVATTSIATPTHNYKLNEEKRRDLWHESGKPKPSVATQTVQEQSVARYILVNINNLT